MTDHRGHRNRWVGPHLLLTLLVAGCAAPVTAPPEVAGDLTALKKELVTTRAQLQQTIVSLRTLTTAPGDLQGHLDRFSSDLQLLLYFGDKAKEQKAETEENIDDFFATWNGRISALETEELRDLGKERHTESVESYKKLQTQINALQTNIRPYATDLKEVNKYLNSDPTPEGIAAVKPVWQRILDNEKPVLASIDRVVGLIDAHVAR